MTGFIRFQALAFDLVDAHLVEEQRPAAVQETFHLSGGTG
jgi:hypothetical protein